MDSEFSRDLYSCIQMFSVSNVKWVSLQMASENRLKKSKSYPIPCWLKPSFQMSPDFECHLQWVSEQQKHLNSKLLFVQFQIIRYSDARFLTGQVKNR